MRMRDEATPPVGYDIADSDTRSLFKEWIPPDAKKGKHDQVEAHRQ